MLEKKQIQQVIDAGGFLRLSRSKSVYRPTRIDGDTVFFDQYVKGKLYDTPDMPIKDNDLQDVNSKTIARHVPKKLLPGVQRPDVGVAASDLFTGDQRKTKADAVSTPGDKVDQLARLINEWEVIKADAVSTPGDIYRTMRLVLKGQDVTAVCLSIIGDMSKPA